MTKKPYRILFTGPRDYNNPVPIRGGLSNVVRMLPPDREIVVVHGACPTGADSIADHWARTTGGARIQPESHPAKWTELGNKAGPIRNQHMVDLGADICLAVIAPCTSRRCRRTDVHPSHGTSGCADLAEAAGIPTFRYDAMQEISGV